MDKIYQAIKLNFQRYQEQLLALLAVLLLGSGLILAALNYLNAYQSRFFPQVYLDEMAIGGLTKDEAQQQLEQNWQEQTKQHQLKLIYDPNLTESTSLYLDLEPDLTEVLDRAFDFGKTGNVWQRLLQLRQKQQYLSQAHVDEQQLASSLDQLAEQFDQLPHPAQASLNYSGQVNSLNIDPGQSGRSLLKAETQEKVARVLDQAWLKIQAEELLLPVVIASTSAQLTPDQLATAQQRAKSLIGIELFFIDEYDKIKFNDQDLISIINLADGLNQQAINQTKLDQLVADRSNTVNRPAQNASFQFHRDEQGQIVVDQFVPDLRGLKVDQAALTQQLIDWLSAFEQEENKTEEETLEFALPMTSSQAEITLADTNDFGIKQLVGFGESWYFHSIASRIHNVSLASQNINWTLVAPNEEFSFNQSLGEVSTTTGYQTAYIIQDGSTQLAPGGGVCQVSSTLFRALLDAGVKITRRLPHSYRVSYYEINNDPGFDATVYAGDTDLRFVNDTPGYLLLEFTTYPEDLYMTVRIYGTSDGRSNEIVDYKKWGYQAAPEPVYIPDPNLAPGQLEQIDWASSGIKAEFTNLIKNQDGEIIREDYYYSSYQPWSAKYLQGI